MLFLLTNSDLSYTEAVMVYLLEGEGGYEHWEDFFESVWVTARKPLFFDCREPALVLGARSFEQGGRYQLEARLGVSGDQILYVGDHIYGDVLKASSTTGWRTALVVPELEAEVAALEVEATALSERAQLEAERLELESALAAAELELRAVRRAERRLETLRSDPKDQEEVDASEDGRSLSDVIAQRDDLRRAVTDLRQRVAEEGRRIAELSARIERHFNPNWGQLLKERHKHSLFGAQMQTYACMYTSRVSNFAAYSPNHPFRPPRDLLPHERIPMSATSVGERLPPESSTEPA